MTVATKTRKPAMTAEEKKARATAKKQSNLSIIGRAQFKSHGCILTGIEDRNGKTAETFHVTICSGKVTSCVNAATGEACNGYKYSGHCRHCDRAMKYEIERDQELAQAAIIEAEVLPEMVSAGDVEVHVEDSVRSGEFDPWAGLTPDEIRAARVLLYDLYSYAA